MNKKLFIITVLISLLFFINQLKYYFIVMKNIETYAFPMFFILGIILFAIALFIFLKYCPKTFNRLELASTFTIVISMLFISLIAKGITPLIPITNYIGYAAFLSGGIGYFKTKHKMDLSFIVWGLFILLWLVNLYNAMYFEEGGCYEQHIWIV